MNVNAFMRNSTIRINGTGNTVEIHGELYNYQVLIEGNNNSIFVGEKSILLGGTMSEIDDGNEIIIGDCVGIQKGTRIISMEGKKICIGSHCEISYDIEFRNSDAHSLFAEKERSYIRTNPAKDIIIGDNVWIAQQTLILKGTNIGNGCVIGAKSLVHKLQAEPNCLITGSPAKVVRSGIKWIPERRSEL